jgi:hypothetical protein
VWAALMRRAFDVDVLACPSCGWRRRLIATVEDPEAIARSWRPRYARRRGGRRGDAAFYALTRPIAEP